MPGNLYIRTHTQIVEQDGEQTAAITESQEVNRDLQSPEADLELLRRALKTPEVWKARKDYKYCPSCGELVRRTGFAKAGNRKDGLRAYCKTCEAERFKIWKMTQIKSKKLDK